MENGMLLSIVFAMVCSWIFPLDTAPVKAEVAIADMEMDWELDTIQPSTGSEGNGSPGKNETPAGPFIRLISSIIPTFVLPSYSMGVFPHAKHFLSPYKYQSNYLSRTHIQLIHSKI